MTFYNIMKYNFILFPNSDYLENFFQVVIEKNISKYATQNNPCHSGISYGCVAKIISDLNIAVYRGNFEVSVLTSIPCTYHLLAGLSFRHFHRPENCNNKSQSRNGTSKVWYAG